MIGGSVKMLMPKAATASDTRRIFALYKRVSKNIGGIVRLENEITIDYIDNFMARSAQNGIGLVVEHPADKDQVIAEIHSYKLVPNAFEHVLSELTIVVDPLFQGIGIGKQLFTRLLDIVRTERTDILRIELIARESNTKAIDLYKKMGFIIEGRYEQRINSGNGHFEADIPMAWFNENYSI